MIVVARRRSARALRRRAALDPCAAEHVCGHTDLAPGRVVDPFATSVLRRSFNEGELETGNVLAPIARSETIFDDLALLDEVEPLERVGIADFGLDLGQLSVQGIGALLAATARPISLQRLKVTADCESLRAASGEGCFVLIRHNWAFSCGRHDSMMSERSKGCNSEMWRETTRVLAPIAATTFGGGLG